MKRAARILLVAAACFAFIMAAAPHPPRIPGEPPDKILHMLAFAVLGGLSAYSFPNRSIAFLFAALMIFGGLIEIVQAIPALHRDSELADWIADGIAALTSLAAARWIERRASRQT